MLLQEEVEGEAETAFGKTARAAMALHTATREQLRAGFVLVEILCRRGHADQSWCDAGQGHDSNE